ncbi:MAG: transcriptional repressor [Candidatus Aminicenantes bacterium]|nr:transcriptional repressor [Candidatus Aminicenantes bacterium]
MKRSPEELRRIMERFGAVIKGARVKMTPQRLEIYRQTAGSGDHPSIETIYRNVRRKMPNVSLDTVYRTLDLFRGLGLVASMRPFPDRVRFDANTSPHHHFVCTRCGLTRDFTDPALDNLKAPGAARALGRVESTHIEVRGLCPACASGRKMERTIGTRSHRLKNKSTRRD